jgi:hypothetical protein
MKRLADAAGGLEPAVSVGRNSTGSESPGCALEDLQPAVGRREEVGDLSFIDLTIPRKSWISTPEELRVRVGASRHRVRTAPRYCLTVQRFLTWCERVGLILNS